MHRHGSSASFDVTSLASQSPVDLRVRRDLWAGRVPVMFHLAAAEVASMEDPPPLMVHLPRQSYLPLVLQDVRTHFREMTPAMEDELWIEYDGIPLKWTVPIGVLFDLLCPSMPSSLHHADEHSNHSAAPSNSVASSPSMVLPWRLTVHFQSFPEKKLQRCRTLFTVRQHYLNTWKESCYARFASTKIAMSCVASDHAKMWDALLHLREDLHTQTNARIIIAGLTGNAAASTTAMNSAGGTSTTPTSMGGLIQAALENRTVEFLPIRIYLHCTRPSHEEGMHSESHMCPLQRNIKPKLANGQETTVADLIQQVLPSLIDPASQTLHTSTNADDHPAPLTLPPNVRLLVQGFSPPLTTPLAWLATYAAHPDGFLYFTVHIVEQPTEEEQRASMADQYLHSSLGMQSGMGMGGMTGSSMFGGSGLGGMMSSFTSFNPSTLPGYHAANNAVNVVYQHMPTLPIGMPSIMTQLPSIFGASGTTAAPTATTIIEGGNAGEQSTVPLLDDDQPEQHAAYITAPITIESPSARPSRTLADHAGESERSHTSADTADTSGPMRAPSSEDETIPPSTEELP